MHSSDYDVTQIPWSITHRFSISGGGSPVVARDAGKCVASVAKTATGKWSIVLTGTTIQHLDGFKPYLQNKSDGTDYLMKPVLVSWTPSTRTLVVWFYAPQTQGASPNTTPTLTDPDAADVLWVEMSGSMTV